VSNRPSDRIRVRRNPKKGRYERERLEAILDRGLVAHVAFIDRDQPLCIPMLYTRVGEDVYLHGARAGRMMRLLAGRTCACLTVTVLDGLAKLDVWAGELPLAQRFLAPVASPGLHDGIPLSASVRRLALGEYQDSDVRDDSRQHKSIARRSSDGR